MEGIFGVGVAEILIVLLAMFVIGGPKNTAKWARQLGLWVRQIREYWAKMMAEIEADLGEDGKELMDAARELGKGAKQVTNMSPQKNLLGNTISSLKAAVDVEANTKDVEAKPANGSAAKHKIDQPAEASDSAASDSAPAEPADSPTKYTAWTAPDNKN